MNIEIEINEQQLFEAIENELHYVVDNRVDEFEIRLDQEYEDAYSVFSKEVIKLKAEIEALKRLVKQLEVQSLRAVRLAKK